MSAVDQLDHAVAAVSSAANALRDAKAAASTHENDTASNRARFAALEADDRAFRTAVALKETPKVKQPPAAELADLRTELDVAEQVTAVLAGRLAAAEKAFQNAEIAERQARAEHLREVAMEPALAKVKGAFDALYSASIEAMAAHKVHRDLDPSPGPLNSYDEIHGPVAQMLVALARMDWSTWPYSVRPAWLPMHGRWHPGELPDVYKRERELLADQSLEAAA